MSPFRTIREWAARQILARELRDAMTGGAIPAAPVLSGTFVTPESALGVAAVYAAVSVVSTDLASLPRVVSKLRPDGGKDAVTPKDGLLFDLQQLLGVAPNDDMDSMRWMQAEMSHVLTRGNGFNEIVRNRRGEIQEINILHPARTTPKRTDRGVLYYELDNKEKLGSEDCLHFAGMGFNGIVGYSPITICRQTVGLTIAVEQYGASYFGNSGKTSGWIKMAKKLTPQGLDNFRRTFNAIHQGTQSAHQIGILEEGTDWVGNSFSPEDGQFLGTRAFQVKDIARLYRVPPHKIGDYSESHLANVEESNLDYVAMTLYGWVCMLEAQLNSKLLTRQQRQQYAIHLDMSALMRGNVEARMRRVEAMRNTGTWSVDDILLSEGMNPIGPDKGGDLHLAQIQYVPLEQIGKHPLQNPGMSPINPKPPKTPNTTSKDPSTNAFPGLSDRLNGHFCAENAENGVSTDVQE